MNNFFWTIVFIIAATMGGWAWGEHFDVRNPLLVDVKVQWRNPFVYALATQEEKQEFFAAYAEPPVVPPYHPLPEE